MKIKEVLTRIKQDLGITINDHLLRYYEKEGLFKPKRKNGQRVYAEDTYMTIKEVIILTRPILPLKEVRGIVNKRIYKKALAIFLNQREDYNNLAIKNILIS